MNRRLFSISLGLPDQKGTNCHHYVSASCIEVVVAFYADSRHQGEGRLLSISEIGYLTELGDVRPTGFPL